MEDRFSRTQNTVGKVVHMGSYKERIDRTCRKKNAVRVQVEVACNEPVGENIKNWLTEELGKFDRVVVLDDGPDWVFSIIALHYGQLVELSVVLRQFFRSSEPGTEHDTSTPSGGQTLKPGVWVYESLRFHGLFGVQATELKGFFASMAEEFGKDHLGQSPKGRSSTATLPLLGPIF